MHAIAGRYVWDVKGIDAVQAANIEAVLRGIRPALVVGIDPALGAEVMLRGLGGELIQPKQLLPLQYPQSGQRNRGDHSTFAPANAAVASSRVDDAVRQIQLQHDGTAVAGRLVPRLDLRGPDLPDDALLVRNAPRP